MLVCACVCGGVTSQTVSQLGMAGEASSISFGMHLTIRNNFIGFGQSVTRGIIGVKALRSVLVAWAGPATGILLSDSREDKNGNCQDWGYNQHLWVGIDPGSDLKK